MKYREILSTFLHKLKEDSFNFFSKLKTNISDNVNNIKLKFNRKNGKDNKDNYKSNYKFSIKYKILMFIAGVVFLNILINVIFISLFMNNYYIHLKQIELKNQFLDISKSYNLDNQQLLKSLRNLEEKGISVRIVDKSNKYLYRSFNFNNDLPINMQTTDRKLILSLANNERLMLTIQDESSKNYIIYYLEKINDDIVILSSSVKVITENTEIAKTFIIISSCVTFGIVGIIIYFFSRKITKKVEEVRQITQEISNLEFDKKIEIKSNDELGDFLKNINIMSEKLEDAILNLRKSNATLKSENESLENVEKMRKQLITNISHEFKTPLTIISGYNQILKENILDKTNKNYVEIIISETEKLNQLVIEFLELSKIESASINFSNEEINISKLLDEYIDSMKMEIETKNVVLIKEYEANINIRSDINFVKKIVSNLVLNAIKYCTNEKIIKVSLKNTKEYTILEVFNTCNKLEDDVLNNIWNNLYKNNVTRTNGTGLGLTIVKSICENIKAKYSVENIDNGVIFKIMFPNK